MKSNNRDVSKYLEELEKIKKKSNYQAGSIYTREMEQLLNLSCNHKHPSIYYLIWDSFEFGFVAGLHYAKNQQKKRRKKLAQ